MVIVAQILRYGGSAGLAFHQRPGIQSRRATQEHTLLMPIKGQTRAARQPAYTPDVKPVVHHSLGVGRRPGMGLRLVPATAVQALHIERRWRVPTLLAQVATVSAFQLDRQPDTSTRLSALANCAAPPVPGAELWHTARATNPANAPSQAN